MPCHVLWSCKNQNPKINPISCLFLFFFFFFYSPTLFNIHLHLFLFSLPLVLFCVRHFLSNQMGIQYTHHALFTFTFWAMRTTNPLWLSPKKNAVKVKKNGGTKSFFVSFELGEVLCRKKSESVVSKHTHSLTYSWIHTPCHIHMDGHTHHCLSPCPPLANGIKSVTREPFVANVMSMDIFACSFFQWSRGLQ